MSCSLSHGAVLPLQFPCNIVWCRKYRKFQGLGGAKVPFPEVQSHPEWKECFPRLKGGMFIGRRTQGMNKACK